MTLPKPFLAGHVDFVGTRRAVINIKRRDFGIIENPVFVADPAPATFSGPGGQRTVAGAGPWFGPRSRQPDMMRR